MSASESRTLKTLRRDGLAAFARKVFRDRVFSTENFIEIALPLDAMTRPRAIDRVSFEVEWARRPEEAAALYASFPRKKRLFDAYFADGAFATFTRKDGEVVGYNWITTGDFFDHAFSRRLIRVPEGGFLSFDGYVEPRHRARAIAPFVMNAFLERMKQDGCHTAHAAVSARNTPSLRLHAMFGYRSTERAFNVHHLFGRHWSSDASPACRIEDYQRAHRRRRGADQEAGAARAP